jgi:dCTP deaminase
MAFLPGDEIRQLAVEGKLFGEGYYDPTNVNQASYDLRLGSEVYIVGREVPDTLTQRDPYASLAPGQFAILTTYEEVRIPNNLLAFINLRFTYKKQGLVNISGFHVDPSFHGKLKFAVQNVGPSDIRLKLREPIFTIFFAELKSDQIGATRDKSEVHIQQNLKGISLEDLQTLGGSNITLAALQKEVHQLRTLILVYGPLAIAAFVGLLARMFLPK